MSDEAKDPIGDRMKRQYEDRTRYMLPRRTYTIIRIDGKAFHTYTRGLEKPYDDGLMCDLDSAAKAVCQTAMGCVFAYGQSDEYSFLLHDFERHQTEAWFDGNLQKIASVAASVFTVSFVRHRIDRVGLADCGSPAFDARVFTIADHDEALNYFVWRQQDATRNAIQMVGDANFSPKQTHKVNTSQLQEMLFQQRGINFNDYPVAFKRGRVVHRIVFEQEPGVVRSRWDVDTSIPVFTADRDYFTRIGFPYLNAEPKELARA